METLLGLREALEAAREFDEKFQLNYLAILIDVRNRPGITQVELQARSHLSRAGLSRIVGALGALPKIRRTFKEPLLRVEEDDNDRRVTKVYLTAHGEELLRRVEKAHTGKGG